MDEAAVVVDGLRKRYGPVVALDRLSLDVPGGSLVGLLGPNGSGKTTTVSVLSTAVRPDGGAARVCGRDVRTSPAAVRAAIGFAGQPAAADANLTGRENLTLIGRLSRVPRRSRHAGPASCSTASASSRSPTGWCAPTRAACGGAWTWPPRWSIGRRSSSSTNRQPASTQTAARRCGR
jgi:ABC-type uncharacterized transport system ATPase subunit